jgi:hypothetical protein
MRCILPPAGALLLLGWILVLPATAAARSDFVIRGGVNASTIHEDMLTASSRSGLAAGLGARVRLNHDFSLLPEIWYHQKGMRSATLWEQIELETRYQTISVPVLLSLWFPATHVDSRAFFGVALDWIVRSEIRRQDRGFWQDVTGQDESVYVSLIVGGGTRWRSVDLDVRYQHGISRATDFAYREFRDVIPLMHPFAPGYDRTWTLSAGYWF